MKAIASGFGKVEDIYRKQPSLPNKLKSSSFSCSDSSWMSLNGDRPLTLASSSSKPASSRSRGFNYEIDEEDKERGLDSDDSSSSTPPCLPVEQDAKYNNLSSKAVIFQLKGEDVVMLVLDEDNYKWKKFWTKKRQFPSVGVIGQWYQLSYDIIGKTRLHLKVYSGSYKILPFIHTKVINGKVNFRASVTQYPTTNGKIQYKCDFGKVDLDVPGTIDLFRKCYLLKVAVWCTPSDLHPHMFALTELCPYENKLIASKVKPVVNREGVGVVCVMLSSQILHVFSSRFAAELVLATEDTYEDEEEKRRLDLGQWLQFSACEQEGIWMIFSFKVINKPGYYTLPCMGKIYMECPVMVSENYAASKGRLHLQAEFGSRVRDDKQLMNGKEEEYSGTVLTATITYCHKEDQLSGYWCLEYIKCIFSY